MGKKQAGEQQVNYIDSQIFVSISTKILNANTLEDLANVGRELIVYDFNGLKKGLITLYNSKKKEIIRS